eukprot:3492900-Amphidinium_carterae.1
MSGLGEFTHIKRLRDMQTRTQDVQSGSQILRANCRVSGKYALRGGGLSSKRVTMMVFSESETTKDLCIAFDLQPLMKPRNKKHGN